MIDGMITMASALAGAVTEESLQHFGEAASRTMNTASPAADPSLWQMAFRMLGALAVVVALALAAAWAARRWLPKGAVGAGGGVNWIEMLGSRSLGMRRALVLARVRGRMVLLGATPQQITCLTEWEDDEGRMKSIADDVIDSAPQANKRAAGSEAFQRLLQQARRHSSNEEPRS